MAHARIAFLIDVDNTLLDNDVFEQELSERLTVLLGRQAADDYWTLLRELQKQSGYVDYLASLQRLRQQVGSTPALLRMSQWFLEYPFSERLYPNALEVLAHLRTVGAAAIVSDGDVVFQPRKIQRSGLWDAVNGEVLIYIHKQNEIAGIRERIPASRYVMIDDKRSILADMKAAMGSQLSTVFARQGHHAQKPPDGFTDFTPDLTVDRIGDLLSIDWQTFLT